MVYYQHDISDVLSNKIPAQLLPKFKDDVFYMSFDQLADKAIRQNVLKLLMSTNIDIRIADIDTGVTIFSMYSTVYSDKTVYIKLSANTNHLSDRTYEFSIKFDIYNELVFTSPALLSPEFKTFYRDLYYAALEL